MVGRNRLVNSVNCTSCGRDNIPEIASAHFSIHSLTLGMVRHITRIGSLVSQVAVVRQESLPQVPLRIASVGGRTGWVARMPRIAIAGCNCDVSAKSNSHRIEPPQKLGIDMAENDVA